jgi:leucyl-tRNA synthetase
MQLIGTSYDWGREIDSSKPEFYRWTQWFFLLLYRKGLAYRDTNRQWWCPTCQTTLSAHEVTGGVCWRGHQGIARREIPAWYFRITAYADALLDGLDDIEWPERVKTMQRNWIGRSDGYEIVFLVGEITSENQRSQVLRYCEQSAQVSEIERISERKHQSGVFSGGFVVNPINQEQVPVWIADYVLPHYGSGAVMGVPAHDERDFRFASRYDLPIKVVVSPPGYAPDDPIQAAYLGHGEMINSESYDGLPSDEGGALIVEYLRENGVGAHEVQYRMRDWLISRQRYWDTPIPIVYCDDCGEVPVPEEELPIILPDLKDFQPDGSGRSPLGRVPEFVNTTCPRCAGHAERETDTMGGFACSSWYFLRFTSPHHEQGPFDLEEVKYWMPVDLYVGGVEHAVLHQLYARFWTHFLTEEGLLPFKEPFSKLLNQGQMMGTDGLRMSKSRGNVITPDHIVEQYGADALRVYELFMAPFEQDVDWSDDGIQGASRFLNRIWKLYSQTYFPSRQAIKVDAELERERHKVIREVSQRIKGLRFNTLISTLMEFVNLLSARYQSGDWRSRTYHLALETLMVLLAPVVPHNAEELWQLTKHKGSVHSQKWPTWEESIALEDMINIPIQVNSKIRAVVSVAREAEEGEIKAMALNESKIKQHLDGDIRGVIYVPGKIMNILVN